MARSKLDGSIGRVVVDGFAFPLGVYPVEEMTPRPGYTVDFEPADGDDEGDWEEWPDRYVFDICISATRLEPLLRALLAMLPGRIYPILDVLGRDAYREVDPYVAYDLIGQERFLDALRRYRAFFFEDGLVGFGAMSEEPFLYVFVDEHKVITVRAETDLKDKVEAILDAFDLEAVDEIAGADAVTHEHRGVLDAPDDRHDLLNADEIVEDLCDDWGLTLNIDADTNVDDDGSDLGTTPWRCIVREVDPESGARRYAEVLLTAASLSEAESLALGAFEGLGGAPRVPFPEEGQDPGPDVIVADRLSADVFAELAGEDAATTGPLAESRVWSAAWLEESPPRALPQNEGQE